jgi:Tfp pilus assembly protein PilX
MIVLVVITLLAVFAIRSGILNLRIAGNMQFRAEASAAAQQAIERQIETIKITESINSIGAQSVPVTIGNATYNVAVAPMTACLLEVPVTNSELNPSNAADLPCFEGQDSDKLVSSTGALISQASGCKKQQWEIEATVSDATTGAAVTHVQGLSIRVPATVLCQ